MMFEERKLLQFIGCRDNETLKIYGLPCYLPENELITIIDFGFFV